MTTDSSHDALDDDGVGDSDAPDGTGFGDGDAPDEIGFGDVDGVVGDVQESIQEARQRLADVPAEVVVTNHVMGLYELAAIHLSAPTPDLRSAALAIDAVACLVDGLGDRIGENAPTMRDALANIRMAFVQIKAAAQST